MQTCVPNRHSALAFPTILYLYSILSFYMLYFLSLQIQFYEISSQIYRVSFVCFSFGQCLQQYITHQIYASTQRTIIVIKFLRKDRRIVKRVLFKFLQSGESLLIYLILISLGSMSQTAQAYFLSLHLLFTQEFFDLLVHSCPLINFNNYIKKVAIINLLTLMSSRKKQQSSEQKLHLIPQVTAYKFGQEPLLSDWKKTSIQQKLKLEKQAVYNAKNRQTNMDYYIKYNYNPFMEYRGRENIQMQSYIKNNRSMLTNVVDKLTEMKISQPPIKSRIQQKSLHFKQQKVAFSMFSDKILNNIQKQKSKGTKLEQIKSQLEQKSISLHRTTSAINIQANTKKPQKIQKVAQQITSKQPTLQNIMNFQIQSIVGIKQQNHFLNNTKKINIFKIVRGEDDQISSKEMLKKMHFCNNGTIQKIAKIKIPIYRDISIIGRRIIIDLTTQNQNIIDYVDSYQLSFKLKELIFHDIMSVASNRLSSDFLNKMLNFQEPATKQMSDTSSEEQPDQQIIYKKNQHNAQDNFVNSNQEIQQIHDYMNLKYNKPEKDFQNRCLMKKNNVSHKLQLKKDLVCRTVKDLELHHQINTVVQQQLTGFTNMKDDPLLAQIEVDRLVRQHKILKTKNQSIKLKTLIQTLAGKNKHEQLLKGNNQRSNKSKSPAHSPFSKKI